MAAASGLQSHDLTKGPIASTLMFFALPTLFSNILQSLNASINTIWVGQFLGETALAATANASIIMFLLFAAVFGFGMAATVMVGQFWGRHDVDSARRAFGSAVGFCLVLSILVSLSGWYFTGSILDALKTPTDAYADAYAYLRIIFMAMPAAMMAVMLMMGLRGTGDAMTPMWFMVLNVVLDTIFNPVLILGLGPFPKMGIAGSATATVIAGYCSLIAMVVTIYGRDLPLRLRGVEWRYLIPQGRLLKLIVTKGVPMSLQMLVMATAGLVMIGLVNREGLLTTAAYGAMQQVWNYIQMPAMAVGAAVSAMAAQNIGVGNWDRVHQITRSGLIGTGLLTAGIIILLLIFDHPVLSLFLGGAEKEIVLARHMQTVTTWSFLFFGLTMVVFATMRANGAVIVPLLILFIALYPVRLGVYWLFYGNLGADAIWLSFPIGALVSLVLAGLYYHYGHWRGDKTPKPLDDEEAHAFIEAKAEPAGRFKPNF